jgi:hypothetical protein
MSGLLLETLLKTKIFRKGAYLSLYINRCIHDVSLKLKLYGSNLYFFQDKLNIWLYILHKNLYVKFPNKYIYA